MSINKIEYKEAIWETTTDENGKTVHKCTGSKIITVTREEYIGDFDRLILKNLSDYKIEDYAESYLGMVEEDECDCNCSIDDYSIEDLQYAAKDYGYEMIPCRTLTDSMKLQKLKEIMEI